MTIKLNQHLFIIASMEVGLILLTKFQMILNHIFWYYIDFFLFIVQLSFIIIKGKAHALYL